MLRLIKKSHDGKTGRDSDTLGRWAGGKDCYHSMKTKGFSNHLSQKGLNAEELIPDQREQ